MTPALFSIRRKANCHLEDECLSAQKFYSNADQEETSRRRLCVHTLSSAGLLFYQYAQELMTLQCPTSMLLANHETSL